MAVTIDTNSPKITNFELSYLIDEDNLPFETIKSKQFLQKTSSKKSFGFLLDKTLWLKTDIKIKSDIKELFIQQTDAINVMDIVFYLFEDDKLILKKEGGITHPDASSSDFHIRTTIEKDKTYTLYAKYKSQAPMLVDINIFDEEHYYGYIKTQTLLFGLFLGVGFAMLFYNLFLYYSLGYSQYLIYVVFLGFLIVLKSTQSGIPIEYFGVSSSNYHYFYYSFLLATVPGILFIQKVLRTKEYLPRIDKILNFVNIYTILVFLYVLAFVDIYDYIYTIYLNIFGSIIFIALYAYAYYKKVPTSLYMLIVNIPFLLIIFRSQLLFFGWIDYDYLSRFGHLGALVYDSIAFSLLVSYYIKQLNKENELQKDIMFQKEKQSELGELLVYITHQWRAPLARLSSIFTLNGAKIKKGHLITNEEWIKSLSKSNEIVNFMTETINNFTSFYVPEKHKETFKIKDAIDNIWKIVGKEFDQENISFSIKGDESTTLYGVSNDISQVVLSLITNSKKIFIQRDIDKPNISITILQDDKNIKIIVRDNAGGSTIKPIEKLFEPFIKDENLSKVNASSGIGLYLVKNILDSFGGKIEAVQTDIGLDFIITLPKDTNV
jgi:signal transduction histidine kinase